MQTLTHSAERVAVVLALTILGFAPADNLTHVQPDERTATSRAVVVPNGALVHTSQLLPLDGRGNLDALATVVNEIAGVLSVHVGGEQED